MSEDPGQGSPFPGAAPQQDQPDARKGEIAREGGVPSPEARDEKTGEREKSKENDHKPQGRK